MEQRASLQEPDVPLRRDPLEFVHTRLDLYKKLTEPKVNEMLKRQWFDWLAREMGGRKKYKKERRVTNTPYVLVPV